MKILIVHAQRLDNYPPVYNLIKNLLAHKHQVRLISCGTEKINEKEKYNGLECIPIKHSEIFSINVSTLNKKNLLQKTVYYLLFRKEFRNTFLRYRDDCDIIWNTMSDTYSLVGDLLGGRKFIMQLMELEYDFPKYPKQKLIKVNLKKYAHKALKVVVPEYNRAHIYKAWWNLLELPSVLPNKPYELKATGLSSEDQKMLETVKNEKRKIILYQGVFTCDRDLTEYIKAAQILKDKYVFYMMGRNNKNLEELRIKYPEANYLGFVAPPNHLIFTQYAYIGLLPYQPPVKEVHNQSILNAVYCAPNKIFEYAAFGLPMIGPDLPGLYYAFNEYNIGRCVKHVKADEIVIAIKYIEQHHDAMSHNCKAFYDSVDLDEIVENILMH